MMLLLNFLFGFADSLSQGAIIKIFKYFRGSLSLHQNDEVFKKTLYAMKRTYSEFFLQYDDRFGVKKESFLRWEKNILLLLNYIRMSQDKPSPAQFIKTDLSGRHPVDDEALLFLIETYENGKICLSPFCLTVTLK